MNSNDTSPEQADRYRWGAQAWDTPMFTGPPMRALIAPAVRSSRRGRSAAIALGILALTACQSFNEPLPPQPRVPPSRPQPQAPPPEEQPPEPPAPVQPPVKQFRLSAASSALVAQAQTQAKSGDSVAATATLERALRIEPTNPLLWIELGRLRLNENNAAQADSMGRKALALATGDRSAQAAAWRLIAESLRARGRNQEASEAEERADALVMPVADEEGDEGAPSEDWPDTVWPISFDRIPSRFIGVSLSLELVSLRPAIGYFGQAGKLQQPAPHDAVADMWCFTDQTHPKITASANLGYAVHETSTSRPLMA